MNKVTPVLLVIISAVVLISGCVTADPQGIALANPMMSQFLYDYPNAEVTVVHYSESEAVNVIDDVRTDCEKSWMEPMELFKVTVEDSSSGFSAIAWIDAGEMEIECAIKRGVDEETMCIDNCGDGVCDELVCQGTDCSCPETYDTCPEDCTSSQGQWLNYYQCSNGWRQRKWQPGSGNYEWKNYEYCTFGCSNGKCLSETQTGQWLDQYQCFDDWVKRKYQNADGSQEWQKYQYCQYGCENGACLNEPVQACTDTDGGEDYFVKGFTTTETGLILEDACGAQAYEGYVIEYSCESVTSDTYVPIHYECVNGCSDGACIKPECVDTDSGDNYFVKGKVVLEDGFVLEDACGAQAYEGYVIEYSCESVTSDTYVPIHYECVNGCSDGACITGTVERGNCTDFDSGLNFFERSNVTVDPYFDGSVFVLNDNCGALAYEGNVIEYSCDPDYVTTDTYVPAHYECPNGCADGVCVKTGCVDTDGGVNYFERGSITIDPYFDGSVFILEDACGAQAYEGYVIEYSCESEYVTTDTYIPIHYECPNGCADGVCI